MRVEYAKLAGVALATAAVVAVFIIIVAARNAGPSPEAMLRITLDSLGRSKGWSFQEKITAKIGGRESIVEAHGIVYLEEKIIESTIIVKPARGIPTLYTYYRNGSTALLLYEGHRVNAGHGPWTVKDTVLYKSIVAAMEEPDKEIHREEGGNGYVVVASGPPSTMAEELYEKLYSMAAPNTQPPSPDMASILVTVTPQGAPKGVLLVYYTDGDKVLEAIYLVKDFNSPPKPHLPTG